MITPSVEAHMLSMLGCIHGVRPDRVRVGDERLNQIAINCTFHGWSPSLHDIRCKLDLLVPKTVTDPDQQIARMTSRWAKQIKLQKARAAEGLKIGTAVPLDPQGEIDARHVLIDEGLALILLPSLSADEFEKRLSQYVGSLHFVVGDYDGGDILCNDDRVENGVYHSMIELSPGILYDGRDLVIEGADISHTLRTAVVGRELGEVVEVPDTLAGHVIESWTDDEYDAGWTRIRVTPHLIQFRNVGLARSGQTRPQVIL